MPIRAVLWDLDDTLFDYRGSDRAGALRHLEAEGVLSRFSTVEAALARWRSVGEEQFARFRAGELGFAEHRRERARCFLGERLPDAEADAWFARYVALYEQSWRLFPDAVPALDALTPGYRHGVLSNAAAAHQERKLRLLGLRDRIEVLLCADELGCAKPAPEAFLAGCAALSLEPGEVAYVGDRADTDARAADAAGVHGIWLDRTVGLGGDCDGAEERDGPNGAEGAGPPVRRIAGLAELSALLAEL